MKKNIFIAGVARSGKSTFAEKLLKYGYNHIPLDYFTTSLKRNFPNLGIKNNVIIDEKSSTDIAKLLTTVCQIIDSKDEKFVIDSAHIMPCDLVNILDEEKWDIYFLGYPNISVNEKVTIIRKYDNENDWTSKKTDQELKETIRHLIELSQKIAKECENFNIPFIDTSQNIQEIEKYISKYEC